MVAGGTRGECGASARSALRVSTCALARWVCTGVCTLCKGVCTRVCALGLRGGVCVRCKCAQGRVPVRGAARVPMPGVCTRVGACALVPVPEGSAVAWLSPWRVLGGAVRDSCPLHPPPRALPPPWFPGCWKWDPGSAPSPSSPGPPTRPRSWLLGRGAPRPGPACHPTRWLWFPLRRSRSPAAPRN